MGSVSGKLMALNSADLVLLWTPAAMGELISKRVKVNPMNTPLFTIGLIWLLWGGIRIIGTIVGTKLTKVPLDKEKIWRITSIGAGSLAWQLCYILFGIILIVVGYIL
jgi:hypothetical protein